jgi:S-DNA-T family DNA segregation ATPase FtsK/SpoIIIE
MGAEQLLGKGDMLFMANGAPHLQRIHGAFVSEEECTGVAEHLKSQGKPTYITSITKDSEGAGNGNGGEGEGGEDDPLYARAIEVVAREQKASTSFIQRHLQIGYNRAARLIDRMEMEGLISAPDHVGKREVIVRKPPAEGYGT